MLIGKLPEVNQRDDGLKMLIDRSENDFKEEKTELDEEGVVSRGVYLLCPDGNEPLNKRILYNGHVCRKVAAGVRDIKYILVSTLSEKISKLNTWFPSLTEIELMYTNLAKPIELNFPHLKMFGYQTNTEDDEEELRPFKQFEPKDQRNVARSTPAET